MLCLQELKTDDANFPHEQVGELGYTAAVHGTGRWNGVGILCRVGIDDVVRGLVGEPGYQPEDAMFEATEPRALGATCGGLRIWTVYVPNGRELGHPHYDYKLAWLDALADDRPRRADRPVRRHRRLQHRADRRRRVGRRARCTARRTSANPSAPSSPTLRALGPDRRGAARAEVRHALHLLGLPGRHVPQEPRHADRPGLRERHGRGRASPTPTSTARRARARLPRRPARRPTTPRSWSTSPTDARRRRPTCGPRSASSP